MWRTVDEACDRVVRVRSTVPPNSAARQVLEARYRAFRAIYPATRAIAQAAQQATTETAEPAPRG